MLQLYPVYLLWNRRKTLTGSPEPQRMLPVQISLATFSWYHVLIAEPEDKESKPEGPWCNLRQCEYHVQWRIQDFLGERAPTPRGAPTYDFAIFSQKLHEIERIWASPRVGGTHPSRPPSDPPLTCMVINHSSFCYFVLN